MMRRTLMRKKIVSKAHLKVISHKTGQFLPARGDLGFK